MNNTERLNKREGKSSDNGSKIGGTGEKKGYVKMGTVHEKWEPGTTTVRAVGDFYETHMHGLSPNDFGSVGVMPKSAFGGKGSDFIPWEVCCLDWDMIYDEYRKERSCPFCKLNFRASCMLKNEDLSKEDIAKYTRIKNACHATSKIRWNIIDRNDPTYTFVNPDGTESNVKGYKIGGFGMSVFKTGIKGLFTMAGGDIADVESGIDFNLKRGKDEKGKTVYEAIPVMEKGAMKFTPLTDEQKSWKLWNIPEIFGKDWNFEKIYPLMHEEFRELLDMTDEEFREFSGYTGKKTEEHTEEKEDKKDVKKNKKVRTIPVQEPQDEDLPF
ncbi:MAG: hypothetical protein M0P12_00640 [Paludibacteraceae bacterium]|nr:hypothetical protein [Paludibacteraceae bacterium]